MSNENNIWWKEFNSDFWFLTAGAVLGFGGVIIQGIIKSRCKNVNICYGMLKCERDLEAVDADSSSETTTTPPPAVLPNRN